MTFSWGDVKDEIERLYMKEGKSLDEVRDILKKRRNFNPSVRAYKDKFEEWGYKKYNRRRREPIAQTRDLLRDLDLVQTTEIASALLANSDSEAVTANLVQVEQELELLASDAREQQMVLSKASRKRRREDAETDIDEVKHSIQRVAKLEASLTQMRKALERVMTSVHVQTAGPTGFASCWKQAPMTLEDAHGRLLLLPLELVVSWEVFDSILLGHFRKIAGERKVEKRENEIEDGSTGGALTRKVSWSRICKPGRKIDMSMVFKDVDKSSIVCPKCGAISKEKKGVQVECSNSECKMIFRTEDDEYPLEESSKITPDLSIIPTMGRAKQPSTMELEISQESPAMFKRVVIRLRSVQLSSQPRVQCVERYRRISLPRSTLSNPWLRPKRIEKSSQPWTCVYCPRRRLWKTEHDLWEHAKVEHSEQLPPNEGDFEGFKQQYAADCAFMGLDEAVASLLHLKKGGSYMPRYAKDKSQPTNTSERVIRSIKANHIPSQPPKPSRPQEKRTIEQHILDEVHSSPLLTTQLQYWQPVHELLKTLTQSMPEPSISSIPDSMDTWLPGVVCSAVLDLDDDFGVHQDDRLDSRNYSGPKPILHNRYVAHNQAMPAYQKLHRVQQQQDPSLGDNQALPLTFVDTPIPVVVPNQTLNMSAMDLFDSIFWDSGTMTMNDFFEIDSTGNENWFHPFSPNVVQTEDSLGGLDLLDSMTFGFEAPSNIAKIQHGSGY